MAILDLMGLGAFSPQAFFEAERHLPRLPRGLVHCLPYRSAPLAPNYGVRRPLRRMQSAARPTSRLMEETFPGWRNSMLLQYALSWS